MKNIDLNRIPSHIAIVMDGNGRWAQTHGVPRLAGHNAGMLAMGVALGGAVGAIAGILYAPKAERETREELSQRSCQAWGKMKDNVSATGHKLVDAVEEKSARVYTAAEKGVDAAKESFKETSDLREKNA